MPAWPSFIPITDLAPGDTRTRDTDWTGLRLHAVASPDDPLFAQAYEQLHLEFGWRGELETPETLVQRLAWNPALRVNGCHLLYRLQLLFRDDTCLGLRDHTAILPSAASAVVVHLSHILVPTAYRRSGVAGLLRTLPIVTARECAAAAGRPDLPITLVAEMDPFDPAKPESLARSTAYAKAGYRALPADFGYLQPDFRDFAAIDAAGGPRPLPLQLHLRRLRREHETTLPAAEALATISALYAMYRATFRPADLTPCLDWLARRATTLPATLPLTTPAS